mmetsp:Transcript_64054/g.191200  ORF Transcript_64054/g.191200 Transcript_64054/m.191200 type:complete len:1009 (-) Transcript_64054:83-3109(-)
MPAAPPAAKAPEQKSYQVKSQKAVYATVPAVPLLVAYMSEAERKDFVESMTEVQVKKDSVVMRQGDKGNNFYIIKDGFCDVEIESNDRRALMRTLGPGSWCGEQSLLTGNLRSATVISTSTEVTLLMVNRRMFNGTIGDKIAKKRDALVPFLKHISIFSELRDPYESFLVADAVVTKEFAQGATIHEAGAASDGRFYLMESGAVDATPKRKYQRGDFFGQVELLQNAKNQEKRVAASTNDGKEPVICHTLNKEDFMKLVPLHAFVKDTQQQQFALANDGGATKMRGRRFGESAEATTMAQAPPSFKLPQGSKKAPDALARIMAAIKRNIIFSRLNEAQIQMLQQVMSEHHVSAGQNVVTQGEKGNHFYVVDAGELDVFVRPDGSVEEQAVKAFGAGDSFGELALMYNCPRTATIRARTDVVLWSLDRVSFRMIVLEANTKKTSMYETFLEKVSLLESLTKDQRNRMVDALEEVQYQPGEAIINEGEEGQHFYMIVEGEVSVVKKGQEGELAHRGVGDYFGELSLKTGAATMASVIAAQNASKPTKLVRMDRGAFQRLLGPLDTMIEMRKYTASGAELAAGAGADTPEDAALANLTAVPKDHAFEKATGPMKLSDFLVTSGTLGEGAFGKVRRCKIIASGKVFALKQMQKADIVSMGQVEHIMQETQILSTISHPFVTNKFTSVTTPSNLILIMEFCPGGDLFDQLYKHKSFTPDDTAIFTSQVLLPLEYLHSLGIVHRDLKLENLLLHNDQIKVADFGMASVITPSQQCSTLCGSPDYAAPELLTEHTTAYDGVAADVWSAGVILYAFLCRQLPFQAYQGSMQHLFRSIRTGEFLVPPHVSVGATGLVSSMLTVDAAARPTLPAVRSHPWMQASAAQSHRRRNPISSSVSLHGNLPSRAAPADERSSVDATADLIPRSPAMPSLRRRPDGAPFIWTEPHCHRKAQDDIAVPVPWGASAPQGDFADVALPPPPPKAAPHRVPIMRSGSGDGSPAKSFHTRTLARRAVHS